MTLKVVSDKSEPVSELENNPALVGAKLPPLGQRGGYVFMVILSATEMSFPVEVVKPPHYGPFLDRVSGTGGRMFSA